VQLDLLAYVKTLLPTEIAVLLYVWTVSAGIKTVRNGQRNLVDRNDRRDLSIFQIGLRSIERLLIKSMICPVNLCLYR